MHALLALKVIVMGIVEGLTEFLPVSSTGHLIVAGQLIGFMPKSSDDAFRDLFEVVIQLGPIIAVALLYRERIVALVRGLLHWEPAAIAFARNLLLALLPAIAVGSLASKYVEAHFFNAAVVAGSLAVGGLAILLIERHHAPARSFDAEHLTWRIALAIGCWQCLSIILPGMSRSAVTIMGAMLLGVERKAATNFSFMLAIPTMFAATVYKLKTQMPEMLGHPEHVSALVLGFVVAFIVAWVSVAWLLRYISSHTFVAFGWYRIAAGCVIAVLLLVGLLTI
jgi:undecaprenyl-diphosphatase